MNVISPSPPDADVWHVSVAITPEVAGVLTGVNRNAMHAPAAALLVSVTFATSSCAEFEIVPTFALDIDPCPSTQSFVTPSAAVPYSTSTVYDFDAPGGVPSCTLTSQSVSVSLRCQYTASVVELSSVHVEAPQLDVTLLLMEPPDVVYVAPPSIVFATAGAADARTAQNTSAQSARTVTVA